MFIRYLLGQRLGKCWCLLVVLLVAVVVVVVVVVVGCSCTKCASVHVQCARVFVYKVRGCSCTMCAGVHVQGARVFVYNVRGCSCTRCADVRVQCTWTTHSVIYIYSKRTYCCHFFLSKSSNSWKIILEIVFLRRTIQKVRAQLAQP